MGASIRSAFVRGFTRLLIALARILPPAALLPVAHGVAWLAWHLYPRIRHVAMRNLEIAFGDELSSAERRKLARGCAREAALTALEFFYFTHWPAERVRGLVKETEGWELLEQALAQGKGVLGLAMHFGNWEMSGAYLALSGAPLAAVGKEQRDDFFTNLAFPTRQKLGIENIPSGKMGSAMLRTLRSNKVLGLLADQNGGADGTFVPFFGTIASTARGPAVLHLRLGAPLLLIVAKRLKPFEFRLIVRPVECEVNGKGEEAEREVLAAMNRAYEQVIREAPEQWLWIHRRWKTRPPGEKPLY
jgi:KDO2-lipid IV(A) lauroyltransferase